MLVVMEMNPTTRHEVQIDTEIAAASGEFIVAARRIDDLAARRALPEYATWQAAEARYTGWTRFYAGAKGHIHNDMNCPSCNKGNRPTIFGWLTDLSGLTADDVIAAYGPTLCTVCFPNAPVETTAKVKIAATAAGFGFWGFACCFQRCGKLFIIKHFSLHSQEFFI